MGAPLVYYCLSFFDLLWLSLWYLMVCPCLIYSDYPIGILWPVLLWFILIISLISLGLSFFDILWLSLWYLMTCPSLIYSDYDFGILWTLFLWFTLIIPLVYYGLSFFNLWLLNNRLVSYGLSFVDLLWLSLWYLMTCPSLIYSDYPFGILWPVLCFTLIFPVVSYGLFFFDLV